MSIINTYFAIFDSNNLANSVTGLTILGIDNYMPPKRKLSIYKVARTNRNKVPSAFWEQRTIKVRVCIQRASREDVQSSIDDLISILQGIEKELWIPQAGETRKYYCTLGDVNVLKGGGAYWEAELMFTCSDTHGYSTQYDTIVSQTGITATPRTDQYNFKGSAEWQVPYIRITFTAVSGATSKILNIGNTATGQQISISRTFLATDVVEIDSRLETVKVNGIEVAFTGAFPRFAKGLGNLQISHNFTSATFNELAYYYRRYSS